MSTGTWSLSTVRPMVCVITVHTAKVIFVVVINARCIPVRQSFTAITRSMARRVPRGNAAAAVGMGLQVNGTLRLPEWCCLPACKSRSQNRSPLCATCQVVLCAAFGLTGQKHIDATVHDTAGNTGPAASRVYSWKR